MTIIVLLILSGITIGLVFGPNGVMKKAQEADENTKIAQVREKLELAKGPEYIEGNGQYDPDSYFQRIEDEKIINDKDKDVVQTGDGVYEVTTIEGYIFKITLVPSKDNVKDIQIDYIGKADGPRIKNLSVSNKTTSSITVEVETSNAEGATYTYYYKKDGEAEWIKAGESEESTYTFSGLEANVLYNIKVKVEKNGKTAEKETSTITGELPEGAVQFSTITWNDGQASTVITTSEEGYTLQYQIDGISENNWTDTTSGSTIGNLQYGTTVYGRLYDGKNGSKTASIDVDDKIVPQSATITLNSTSVAAGATITATVTHVDNESGVEISNCKWVYNTINSPLGTEESSYDNVFNNNGQQLSLTTSTPGVYYLHVLSVDKAGNKIESISQPVNVQQLVTSITISASTNQINIGQTLALTANVQPSNAANKTVTWQSNNTSIATVNGSGVVTGVSAGSATITAKATDGSNVTGSYNITVKDKSSLEKLIDAGTYVTEEKVTVQDKFENSIVVPKGFKATPDGITIPEGVVIEDRQGNQFVWIPVGTVYKNEAKTSSSNIQLGRYTFDTTNGTPTLGQAAYTSSNDTNYTNQITVDSTFQELAISREGVDSLRPGGTNTTAKNLAGFVNSVRTNGGYYLARYEASYGSGTSVSNYKPLSKPSTSTSFNTSTIGSLWNNVTQLEAAKIGRNMYNNDSTVGVESDLINSYAWDTAIVFIQEMGNSNYANKEGASFGNTTLRNTGTTGSTQDKVCNIFDMASNCLEWSTEYSTKATGGVNPVPCTARGGTYYDGGDLGTEKLPTSLRLDAVTRFCDVYTSFRVSLWIK